MPVDFNKRLKKPRAAKPPQAAAEGPPTPAEPGGPAGSVALTFQQAVARAVHEQQLRELTPGKFSFCFPNGICLPVDYELNAGQQAALVALAEWADDPTQLLFNLQGYAGTGKTTIMRLFVSYLRRLRRKQRDEADDPAQRLALVAAGVIMLAAPTHRARQVLYNLAGQDVARENCLTLHALLALKPDFDMDELDLKNVSFATSGSSKVPAGGLVIVDECSMVSDGLYQVLAEVATRLRTKFLFVGDPAQLKPVKQDTISATFRIRHRAELRQVMRQRNGNPISWLLETIRNSQHLPHDAYQRYDRLSAADEGIRFTQDMSEARDWVSEHVLSEAFARDPTYVRVLCGTNLRCQAFNQSLRAVRFGREADEYEVGDLLSGYANYGRDPLAMDYSSNLITNSADYLVVAVAERERTLVGLAVPGWQLTLVDADAERPVERRAKKSVFVVARRAGNDVLARLAQHLQELAREARERARRKEHRPWDDFHAFKESFCTAVDFQEGTYTRLKRTLGYGYAMTVHKSQGGTYQYVLVDEADIDAGFGRDHQLRHQLKYVALSRASKQVLCITSQPIVEPEIDF